MINEVRNVVLFFLSKENRGYLSPIEFNSFAELAQRSIFENDFYSYNKLIIKQSNRQTNGEYADLPKNLRERIDVFSDYTTLSKSGDVWSYSLPNVYRVEGLSYNNTDIEEVSKLDINKLNNTPLIASTSTYPVYIRVGSNFKIFPSSITNNVQMYYLKTPTAPKWTYVSVGGNPLFNPSASDYKDLELHPSCFEEVVAKILSYAGLSINSEEVTKYVDQQTQLEALKK